MSPENHCPAGAVGAVGAVGAGIVVPVVDAVLVVAALAELLLLLPPLLLPLQPAVTARPREAHRIRVERAIIWQPSCTRSPDGAQSARRT
jgi:hypothetical protein